MFKLFIISTIFVIWYAWSRSMHDKYLFGTKDYKWHWWALQEAFVLNTIFIIGLFMLAVASEVSIMPWKFIVLWPINAFFFWMIFDCLMGWHGKRDIWYIGHTGFDLEMRKAFLYERKNIRGKIFFLVKLLWYVIFTFGAYFEYNLNDLL